MVLKLLISLIFISAALQKFTGKVAPNWERWGYSRQFMYATGLAELVALALLWWPGLELVGAAGLGLLLLGALATLNLLQDADHSFHVPARTGRRDAEVRAEMLDTLAMWIGKAVPRS